MQSVMSGLRTWFQALAWLKAKLLLIQVGPCSDGRLSSFDHLLLETSNKLKFIRPATNRWEAFKVDSRVYTSGLCCKEQQKVQELQAIRGDLVSAECLVCSAVLMAILAFYCWDVWNKSRLILFIILRHIETYWDILRHIETVPMLDW